MDNKISNARESFRHTAEQIALAAEALETETDLDAARNGVAWLEHLVFCLSLDLKKLRKEI